MFNRVSEQGLSNTWIIHVIVPTCKSGDHVQPGNYQAILIGHTLAKLYGAVLDTELKTYSEVKEIQAPNAEVASVWMLCRFPLGI